MILQWKCVDGSIVNGKRQWILFSFNVSAPPGFKIFKESTSILLKKVNEEKFGYIIFYLEDVYRNWLDFNGKTWTCTVILIKKESYLFIKNDKLWLVKKLLILWRS